MADELERHRVHARMAGPLALRQPGQLPIVAPRQIMPDRADLGVHEMKMIEQPFRRRRDEQAAVHVVCKRGVSSA